MSLLLPNPEVVSQAVRSAVRHLRARVLGNGVAAALLALALAPQVGWMRVGAWLLTVALALATLVGILRIWRRQALTQARTVRLLMLAELAMGASWGLVGLLASPPRGDTLDRAAILLFFATVSGASALTNAALPILFVAETIPMWGVGLIGVFGGEPLSVLALAGPVLVFIGVLAHHNRRLHRQLRELIELRVHNEMLVRELQAEQQLARDAWNQVSRQQEELMIAYDRASDMAVRDMLTGLFNRRRFFEVLEAASRAAAGSPLGFCVAVLDVDHFKRVNDTYGHGVGDRALHAIATEVAAAVRVHDVVARIGGEEIAILFQRVSLRDATTAAERVRARVEAIRFEDLPELRLSVSVGLAASSADLTGTELVARADASMYLAKTGGRNRVVVEAAA